MEAQSLEVWARNLSEPEKQVILLRAARDYEPRFTNPDDVGMGWAKILREHGYNALGPFARSYLARIYLNYCEDYPFPRRVAIH